MVEKIVSVIPWVDLRVDFKDDEVSWMKTKTFERKGSGDKKDTYYVLYPYVKAEPMMARLDSILTPAGWAESYRVVTMDEGRAMMCRLGIWDRQKLEFVTREGGVLFPTKRSNDSKKSFRQSYVSVVESLAFRAAATRFRIGVFDLEQVSTKNIYTDKAAPFDRDVVEFDIEINHQGTMKEVSAWCERPKLSKLRKR